METPVQFVDVSKNIKNRVSDSTTSTQQTNCSLATNNNSSSGLEKMANIILQNYFVKQA